MRNNALFAITVAVIGSLLLNSTALQAEKGSPRHVYWGDTHLHTRNSMDSYPFGNTNVGPDSAYRFAKGESVFAPGAQMKAQLSRPLDFLVISDHSENLGVAKLVFEGNEELLKNPKYKNWYELNRAGKYVEVGNAIYADIAKGIEHVKDPTVKRSVWSEFTGIADQHNNPGEFTAFIGYEWTSMPRGSNLHRVVIYKDGAEKANQVLPFSALDSDDPEDLWAWLEAYENDTGGSVFAIAHNGNVSNGLMFSDKDFKGKALTPAYAQTRARWEPLYEVTQIKGDGETHPILSATDEFADFATWDKGNLATAAFKEDWMLKHEYARSALKAGMKLEKELGTNPFKFGFIGSTDSHTGLSTADDNNYYGKHGRTLPGPLRIKAALGRGLKFNWSVKNTIASGYAAVWATENTREALYDAMKRRETYATTGPRIVVRLFGGWDFNSDDLAQSSIADIGYAKGVPMGGELRVSRTNSSPQFIVVASKDPDSAHLDRVQIIKGWLDNAGELHEKVYNVAVSDNRSVGADGKVAPVGSTVNVATASYDNSIGEPQLRTIWTDPDFDRSERAFYYARVLEIPTPRWSTYDAVRYNVTLPEGLPVSIQQRAYTSPIWYTPKN